MEIKIVDMSNSDTNISKEKNKRKSISIVEKLDFFKRYKEQIDKEIYHSTVFEGYPIGVWQSQIRTRDFTGALNISNELRKKYEEIGVLGERKRSKRLTDKEKYEVILAFYEKYPQNLRKQKELQSVEYSCIKKYIYSLQIKYNRGSIKLEEDEIDTLIKIGAICPTPKMIKEYAEKYHISCYAAKYILVNYGSIDKFILDYKKGVIELSREELKNTEIKLPNKITICSKSMTIEEKIAYVKLIEEVFQYYGVIEEFKQMRVINIDHMNSLLKSLDRSKREIIYRKYGLKNRKKRTLVEIAKENACTEQAISKKVHSVKKKILTMYKKQCNKSQENEEYYDAVERAFEHLIKEEDIFNPTGIIPASIIRVKQATKMSEENPDKKVKKCKIPISLEERTEEDGLTYVMKVKRIKENEYKNLMQLLEGQKDKQVKLERFMKMKGIQIPEGIEIYK